ncbi:MAG: ferritin-like domain-containing protein [Chitinophagales bacterium]|nr:ferritin-like domain-containing protein [Hyphomicrobiales bacterium]
MAISTLDDLFLHTLKDIYYAEKQIKKALPKMIKKASSPELVKALEAHLEETNDQIETLQSVFEMLGKPARGVKCEAIEGILEEAEEIVSEVSDEKVRDAAIIASSQAVEHYEICRYGSLIAWAGTLGHNQMVEPLRKILDQETATDAKLSMIAKSSVNDVAKTAKQTGDMEDASSEDIDMEEKPTKMTGGKSPKMNESISSKKSGMKKAS